MAQVIVGDLRTGRRWQSIPFTSYRWEQRVNQPETLQVSIPIADPHVRSLKLRNTATEGKAFLGVIEGNDVFAGAGPMMKPDYDRDRQQLVLGAFGIGTHFDGFPILPATAFAAPTTQFVVRDPNEPEPATMSNPAYGTSYRGVSLGTLVRNLIAQANSWPGMALPIVLPAPMAGVHEKSWEATDFKSVWDAIADITKLDGGPDVRFMPRWTPNRLGVEWVLTTGTDARPVIRSQTVHQWDLSVKNSSVRGLTVAGDASSLASVAFFTGGSSLDQVLIERAVDTFLTDAGYPLRVLVDSSHSTVSTRATLAGYARDAAKAGRYSTRFWSFEVRKDQSPFFGQYAIGDQCRLRIRDDPYIPDSRGRGYLREIVGLSGNETPWITVTTAEAFDG